MEKTITIDGNKFMLEEDGVYCGAYLGKLNVWGSDTYMEETANFHLILILNLIIFADILQI